LVTIMLVFTGHDGTLYQSTDGWSAERSRSGVILSRSKYGTLEDELAAAADVKGRGNVLEKSRSAIAKIVHRSRAST
jgi:hypothetical protein